MFGLPGSRYSDPEFSWKFAVPPAAIGFVKGGLGSQFAGDLFVGRRHAADGGRIPLPLRSHRQPAQYRRRRPRLEDRVADNTAKNDITESESLLIGRDFGVGTDIETGPNGNLFVVSVSKGAIFEVFRR